MQPVREKVLTGLRQLKLALLPPAGTAVKKGPAQQQAGKGLGWGAR